MSSGGRHLGQSPPASTSKLGSGGTPVRPDPMKSPVWQTSEQLVPNTSHCWPWGSARRVPVWVAWDMQIHGSPSQNRQGWTKNQGWGQWSCCIPMTVLEISLTAGNGSSKGSQCCTGRSVSWGGGRGERKVIATQRRMEKRGKCVGGTTVKEPRR